MFPTDSTPVDLAVPSTQVRADVAMLALGLERIGWTILDIDIDLRGESPRVVARLRRFDGWLVEAIAEGGGCRLDRFARRPTARTWRGWTCVGDDDVFVARTRIEGPRALLRTLTRYLADNPPEGFPRVGVAEVRRLFAPLLALPEGSP